MAEIPMLEYDLSIAENRTIEDEATGIISNFLRQKLQPSVSVLCTHINVFRMLLLTLCKLAALALQQTYSRRPSPAMCSIKAFQRPLRSLPGGSTFSHRPQPRSIELFDNPGRSSLQQERWRLDPHAVLE